MKSQKILIGFSLVLAILLIPQISIASQIETTTTTVDCEEAPYTFMYNTLYKYTYRILNLTCFQEFLMNQTQAVDGNNSTCEGECDCDPLQIQDRIRDMIQECLNNTMNMFQFWFRHNE